MRRLLAGTVVLMLSACGGAETVTPSRISPASGGDPQVTGMTYQEFRQHPLGRGDMLAAQKRFLTLDRDHNGRLSAQELMAGEFDYGG